MLEHCQEKASTSMGIRRVEGELSIVHGSVLLLFSRSLQSNCSS